MLPMDFSIVNLGCKVNRVESDDVAALLIAKGSKPVALADAQLIVINTCTVTGEAEKKTRKAVRHALRSNDSATVVVTGCAVAIDPTAYEEMSPRVRIVPKGDLMKAVSAAGSPDSLRLGGSFPTRVGIKVQDGCNNACTYCIVHVARGKAWSRPSSEVIEEALEEAEVTLDDLDAVGVTYGPGLVGALLVGVAEAKAISYAKKLPLVPGSAFRLWSPAISTMISSSCLRVRRAVFAGISICLCSLGLRKSSGKWQGPTMRRDMPNWWTASVRRCLR